MGNTGSTGNKSSSQTRFVLHSTRFLFLPGVPRALSGIL